MEIITSHVNADFDSLASMVAAKKIYPEAFVVFPGSQERKLRDFIEVFRPVEIKRLKEIDPARVDTLIIVDTKQPTRLGPLAEVLKNKGLRVHIYDHHPFEKGDVRGEVERIEDVGATATIFTELLQKRKIEPTPMEATILTLGIYEETGCLLFPSTTERDLLAVSYLIRRGTNLNIVSSYLRMEPNMEELDLLNELIKSLREVVVSGIRVGIAQAVRETYVADSAHLAHKLMDLTDMDAVILLLSMEGKIIIVARSRVPELDISEIAREFGGGGHPTAAAATAHEASIEVVAERIVHLLSLHIRPMKVAADIMTSPVITIKPESTVREAEEMMTRYGVNVLPIVSNGKYVGLISREIVEKAIFHGFRRNKAADFSTTDALTARADTPTYDVEAMMIEHNQRFMPILEESRIIGAVTRTDLLRVMYEDFLRRRRIGREEITEMHFVSRNLSTLVKERFPERVSMLLKAAGETAERMGYSAYLVGGSVRDLLLGHENLDIDIVVEGDGIQFAREFCEQFSCKVRSHQRFGTAQIIIDGGKVDVATARTEYYESPAALPTVETSSIKKDLYRRDFTINTLAIKLNPRDFGMLLDFFGGQRDLKEKTIRVLHNLSYVEDPTRAFRAIRFAERFGFKLSRHTEVLIRSAIKMNLFEKLTGSRLHDELMLTFLETNPVSTLRRLAGHELLGVIHRNLRFDEKTEHAFSSMYETLAWFNLLYLGEKVDAGTLYLMALFSSLDEHDREEALDRLMAPPRCRVLVKTGLTEAAEILRELPCRDPVRLYHLLVGRSLEVLLYAMSLARDESRKREISHFLVALKGTRPLLTGKDLQRMGIPEGPLYRKILSEILDERLRGLLKTAADEESYVLSRYGKRAGGHP